MASLGLNGIGVRALGSPVEVWSWGGSVLGGISFLCSVLFCLQRLNPHSGSERPDLRNEECEPSVLRLEHKSDSPGGLLTRPSPILLVWELVFLTSSPDVLMHSDHTWKSWSIQSRTHQRPCVHCTVYPRAPWAHCGTSSSKNQTRSHCTEWETGRGRQ